VHVGNVRAGGRADLTFFQKIIYNTEIVKISTRGTDNKNGTASPATDGGRYRSRMRTATR